MPYTAASLTDATSPVVLTIGDVADRRVLRWLSAWWLRHFRTWTAKPLSVPQMLRLQAARTDAVSYLVTLAFILRQVLPWHWWYRVTGDPVRLISRLPNDLLPIVLQALVTVPGSMKDESLPEESLIEQLRREQRELSYGRGGGRGQVTLATAALSVRHAFGDSWYWNPDRWPTSDGYVPFAVALTEFIGVQALEARRRLEVADGFSLSHSTDRRARHQLEKTA